MRIVGTVVLLLIGCAADTSVALLFSRECCAELFFYLLCSERLLAEFFITLLPLPVGAFIVPVAFGVTATDAALLKAVPLAATYGTFSSKLLLFLLVTAPAVLFGMKI